MCEIQTKVFSAVELDNLKFELITFKQMEIMNITKNVSGME